MSPATPITDAFNRDLFDKRCETYLQFRRDQEEAKQSADELKVWIMAQINVHGIVPTGAEKSRRIESPDFVATVTTGTTVDVNDEKCTELELLLSRAKCPQSFPLLFERRTEYTLAKTAAQYIEGNSWPRRWKDPILALYSQCFRPKTKTPSLEVISRAELLERERKAAAKAATSKPGKLRAGKAAA